MKKSWELTSGNFIHIFVGLLLMGIVNLVLALIVSVGTGFTFLSYEILVIVDSVVVALLFGALSYIFSVVLYRDLSSKGGETSLPGFVA